MDRWSFSQYRRPYLQADSVELDAAAGVCVVGSGTYQYDVAYDEVPAADLCAALVGLRDPGSELWASIGGERAARERWSPLVQYLDDLALLRDGAAHDDGVPDGCSTAALREPIRAAADQVLRVLRSDDAAARGRCDVLREEIEHQVAALATDLGIDHGLALRSRPDPLRLPNFMLRVNLLQLRAWRQDSPVALLCAAAALAEAGQGGTALRACFGSLEAAAGIVGQRFYALRDVRAQLRSFTHLLGASTAPDAGAHDIAEPERGDAGINVLLDLERAAYEQTALMGPSDFDRDLASSTLDRRIAMGVYVEQFHVTWRFVEIIAPLLTKRLGESLRRRAYRYFGEEIGHERLELATCKSLGMDEKKLAAALPLALNVAFVDLFTHMARVEPLGLFAGIFVTEGMLGSPSGLIDRLIETLDDGNPRFAAAARRHEEVNERLQHPSLTRTVFARLPFVEAPMRARIHRWVLLLSELNRRSWSALHEHYGSEPFGLMREPVRPAELAAAR